jgi:co-chaperonin GroES (HSP10)
MKMLNGNVLVKLIADENTTKSGLVLIEKTKYYKIVEVIEPDSAMAKHGGSHRAVLPQGW